ncbi:MAG: Transrane rhomboid family protein [Bacteroidota bacterium]|nr:Transrane rhomboid family protein [Bacteroidota bacterium]
MFNNINTRSVTFNLIMINVLLFFATVLHPSLTQILSLHYVFNTHGFYDAPGFEPYQVLSHMFMHGGFLHILFNMWGLFMFGSILENVWGPKRFLSFYLITGFGAVVLNVLVQMFMIYKMTGSVNPGIDLLQMHPAAMGTYFSQTLGASGAIFGIATAFAMLFPNTELMIIPIPIPIKAKYLMPLYIVFELYLGVSQHQGDDVAHFAHLGGALFGFILVKIWGRNKNTLY